MVRAIVMRRQKLMLFLKIAAHYNYFKADFPQSDEDIHEPEEDEI